MHYWFFKFALRRQDAKAQHYGRGNRRLLWSKIDQTWVVILFNICTILYQSHGRKWKLVEVVFKKAPKWHRTRSFYYWKERPGPGCFRYAEPTVFPRSHVLAESSISSADNVNQLKKRTWESNFSWSRKRDFRPLLTCCLDPWQTRHIPAFLRYGNGRKQGHHTHTHRVWTRRETEEGKTVKRQKRENESVCLW